MNFIVQFSFLDQFLQKYKYGFKIHSAFSSEINLHRILRLSFPLWTRQFDDLFNQTSGSKSNMLSYLIRFEAADTPKWLSVLAHTIVPKFMLN